MRKIDLTYYIMFELVNKIIQSNKVIWQSNPIITYHANQLATNINIISDARQITLNKPSNLTLEKKLLRTQLNQSVFLIKEALRLYYGLNNKTEEMQLLSYPISKLSRMTDSGFYFEASQLSFKAEAFTTEIAAIGITAAKIAKMKDDLQKFYQQIPKREYAEKNHAAMVKLIPEKINETRLMLRNVLDSLIMMYNDEHPEFVNSYKNFRQRNERPGRKKHYSVLIQGNVKDLANLIPLENVSIEAGEKQKQTKTDKNGNYKIRIYKKDANFIKFSIEGYDSITVEIPKEYEKHEVEINCELPIVNGSTTNIE